MELSKVEDGLLKAVSCLAKVTTNLHESLLTTHRLRLPINHKQVTEITTLHIAVDTINSQLEGSHSTVPHLAVIAYKLNNAEMYMEVLVQDFNTQIENILPKSYLYVGIVDAQSYPYVTKEVSVSFIQVESIEQVIGNTYKLVIPYHQWRDTYKVLFPLTTAEQIKLASQKKVT